MRFARPLPCESPASLQKYRMHAAASQIAGADIYMHVRFHINCVWCVRCTLGFADAVALSHLVQRRENCAYPKSTAGRCNSFGGQMTDFGALKQLNATMLDSHLPSSGSVFCLRKIVVYLFHAHGL